MRFSDIPGHDDVKSRLRSLVDNDRIPHALLLEGPAGTGKFALARAMAQYIHCSNRTPDGDSCGKCASCQQHQTFNNVDTYLSFPVIKRTGKAAVSNDYIAEFREFVTDSPFMDFAQWQNKLDNVNAQPQIYVEEANEIIRTLSYTSHGSQYKIVLMWLPERLSTEAANKLLKIVEEPYEDSLFILATDNSRLIIPTIYSRTQRIIVNRYDDAEVSLYLQATQNLSADRADNIARLATGNINTALGLVTVSEDNALYLDLFMELMRKAYTRRVIDLKKWAADLAALGRERQMRFYEYCSRMLRENFMLNLHDPQLVYLNPDEYNFSRNFSPFINERNVEALFDIFNDAREDIAANAYAKLVNFDVAIKVILRLKD